MAWLGVVGIIVALAAIIYMGTPEILV